MDSSESVEPNKASGASIPSLDLVINGSGGIRHIPLLPTSEKGATRVKQGPNGISFRSSGALYLVPQDNGVDFDRAPGGFVVPVTGGAAIDARVAVEEADADPSCALRLFVYDAAGAACGKLNLPLDGTRQRSLDLPEEAVAVAVALRLQGDGRIRGLSLDLHERRSFADILGVSGPGGAPLREESGLASEAIATANRLIAQDDYEGAAAALLGIDSGADRARRLLVRAYHAIRRFDLVERLFDGAEEALRQEPASRLRYLEACVRTGDLSRAAAIIDESLFGAASADFLARGYRFADRLPESLRALLRSRILEEFLAGRIGLMRALPVAHDLIGAGDNAAIGRFLAVASGLGNSVEDRVRLDLFAAQAAFLRGEFARQHAWLNEALGRQRLGALAAIDATRPVSGTNLTSGETAASTGPGVSVVVVAQDAAARIGAAIASILAQTAQPIELLVVDRGSLDGTADAARAAAADDSRVSIESITRETSHAAAYEGAAARAAHAYLMPQPADGWSHPQKIERLLATARGQGVAAVIGQRLRVSETTGLACTGDYLEPDAAGLLYSRAAVGPIGEVGADPAAFQARLQRTLGAASVLLVPDLLQVAPDGA